MPESTTSIAGIPSLLKENSSAIASDWFIPEERRLKFRYPLNLSVRFRILSGTSFVPRTGRTVNVSSGGVLVVSEQPVPKSEVSVAARLELAIEWPSLLDGTIPLQLFAVGRVIRRGESDFAARFDRYQFRTMGSLGQASILFKRNVVDWPASKAKALD